MRIRGDLPSFLQPLHTDEYSPRPEDDATAAIRRRTRGLIDDATDTNGEARSASAPNAAALPPASWR